MTFDAVLLTSFGGPEGPDEVMPFLERVTAGRGVPRERLEEVSQHYLALGGVSPINQQNRLLLEHLRARMDERGVALPLYWGNRNSPPFLVDAVRDIHAAGHRRVLALATSAYSSYSGCRQYRENLATALSDSGLTAEVEIEKARPYFDRAGFAAAFTDGLAAALREVADASSVQVLFTTHSVPLSMGQAAGPDEQRQGPLGVYERQHRDVAERVIAAVEDAGVDPVDWQLAFQSRSGPPRAPWLEPDVAVAIRAAAADGKRNVIVVPIGFVSDHVEVVWDLDHDARRIADEVGIGYVRVATPGVDPRFVDALVDVIAETRSEVATPSTASLCSDTCCRNARVDAPVVPAC